jgi:hypothetical protein
MQVGQWASLGIIAILDPARLAISSRLKIF